MKSIIILLVAAAFASAAPMQKKLPFRNLYKEPLGEIKTKPNPRIIGGEEAFPHAIRYQAYLQINTGNQLVACGGTLVSPNYVLTAAHCCLGAKDITVVLGSNTPQTPDQFQIIVKSTQFKLHENYTGIENDICLIKLPESIPETDGTIEVVPIVSRANIPNTYEGDTARVSGWGAVEGNSGILSYDLLYVEVEIISNYECEISYGELPDVVLCTSGNDGKGVCDGDSGGPLTVDGILVGVVSFAALNCEPGNPSGYVRITKFLDWIENNSDVQIQDV